MYRVSPKDDGVGRRSQNTTTPTTTMVITLALISPNLELNYSLLLFQCCRDTLMRGIDLKKIAEKMNEALYNCRS